MVNGTRYGYHNPVGVGVATVKISCSWIRFVCDFNLLMDVR